MDNLSPLDKRIFDLAASGNIAAIEQIPDWSGKLTAFGRLCAMEQAAKSGHTECFTLLEGPDADPNFALMLAVKWNRVEMARLVLGHGAQIDTLDRFHAQSALRDSAKDCGPELIELLIRY